MRGGSGIPGREADEASFSGQTGHGRRCMEPCFLEAVVMIQVTPQMRILPAVEPTDFRKGTDGLARICRRELGSDPFSGRLFIFRNRRRTAIKILVYDGQGFWSSYKRLSRGRFQKKNESSPTPHWERPSNTCSITGIR